MNVKQIGSNNGLSYISTNTINPDRGIQEAATSPNDDSVSISPEAEALAETLNPGSTGLTDQNGILPPPPEYP